ncbi:DEAD/DEAH box helicase [Caballeronia choica]|uniref:DEAD/DEAH box helicase n=1 Tax=Caballeronia choica TaxID=326476 RepID=A0A158KHP3_9BURK|nr:caspase family protein [Caballeronia choica]SAL80535.1 DEAD/DEAH box helicase [Caballeronia choica]
MSIKGIFVGINKQLDPNISELTGAVRDARALNALFLDSVPGFGAKLLVDEDATKDSVSESIFGTLASAMDDDIIVISFAGHGSPDGGIAVYDTLCSDLSGTTLSMAELGDAFKATRARAVLCILDCCFSGHAPARVLEVPAQPRSAFALEGVAGAARQTR